MTRYALIKKENEHIEDLEKDISNAQCRKYFRVAVDWRLSRAEAYRRWYYALQWTQALFGVVVAILGAFQDGALGIVTTAIGAVSALVPFALSLHQFYDSWKRYRDSIEKIKSLTRLYISKNHPFDNAAAQENDKLYIQTLNQLMSGEAEGWKAMRDRAPNPNQNP